MKGSQVNANMARDLVSNAGSSRVGDMNDFNSGARKGSNAENFEHGKTLLNNRQDLDSQSRQVEEDLRSIKSEYDYGSKKKFIDVLGNVSANAQLNRLRAQHEMDRAGGAGGLGSLKGSHRSAASYKSRLSELSKRSKVSRKSNV